MSALEVSRLWRALIALATIVVLLLAAAVSAALYAGAFTRSVQVHILADRSGLLMDPGSDVKLRGVVIGTVADVEFANNRAELTLDIDPGQLANIPQNVTAHLEPTTVFGRKFVTLQIPKEPSVWGLEEGSVIDNSEVTVEVNDVFTNLVSVLDAVDPQKLNATLGAAATALDGRGDRLGQLLVDLDGYLSKFNGSIPTLQRDLPKLAENADTFADASPEFLSIVSNLSVTSDSIVEKEPELTSFILSFTDLGNSGEAFFHDVAEPLTQALSSLRPTTNLLAQYSPQTVCFFAGMSQNRHFLENTVGGTKPGLNVQSTVLLGDPAYAYPDNLPINAADNAPDCYGAGPIDPNSTVPPHTQFHDGSEAYEREFTLGELAQSPLLTLLYGPTSVFAQ
ncbi:MCE family protein [Rhodococcus sp. (in: high G+C Gram-positive bacteria)]|uniref:MCE family protein n=1 Tax=Rhodococcus sp. TaxID=1831 RepID=UPI00257B1491|nr:MCE family protein [Rhodococcus sp. (in: high G+C Gram-positive bacteria)]MBQ9051230.1 MCE family protein [Rhodococcus sp. (in: high G+C Gram-positive bacteria)]